MILFGSVLLTCRFVTRKYELLHHTGLKAVRARQLFDKARWLSSSILITKSRGILMNTTVNNWISCWYSWNPVWNKLEVYCGITQWIFLFIQIHIVPLYLIYRCPLPKVIKKRTIQEIMSKCQDLLDVDFCRISLFKISQIWPSLNSDVRASFLNQFNNFVQQILLHDERNNGRISSSAVCSVWQHRQDTIPSYWIIRIHFLSTANRVPFYLLPRATLMAYHYINVWILASHRIEGCRRTIRFTQLKPDWVAATFFN